MGDYLLQTIDYAGPPIGGFSGGDVHRVLVVEDEEAVARALERWLRKQGVEVTVILSASFLEPTLTSFNPSVVVSDLNMPGADGIEILARVKALRPQALRVLLSGSLESLDAARLEAVNPCRLVAKPWDETSLADQLGLRGPP